MRLGSEIFEPLEKRELNLLSRTTHLGVGAHQDDLEIMALHGILQCYGSSEQWFTGVTCTDGRGCIAEGPYSQCSMEELAQIRRREQRDAAVIGQYAAVVQLNFSSAEIQGAGAPSLVQELLQLLKTTRPRIIYTHNPADRHPTHIAVCVATIEALRQLFLETGHCPEQVYGCEVWGSLDWLPEEEKLLLDVSSRPNLSAALLGVFDSQISSGKRYDLATLGRLRSNSTYCEPRKADASELLAFAVDLTSLVQQTELRVCDFVRAAIGRFQDRVCNALKKHGENLSQHLNSHRV